MKAIFFLFLTFFYATIAHSYCGDYGFDVFPKSTTIAQNTIFILNGEAFSEDIILNLNKKNNIYLKCGDKKITLLVEKINVGEFSVTQAILKPETILEIGLVYTMCIDSVKLERFNPKTTEYEPVTYTVTAIADTEKPIVRQKPKFFKKSLVSLGCGNVVYVVFKAKIKDNSEIFVKTTVKNLTTKTETVFYLPFKEDKKIYVGNGMCYGPFKFWCTAKTDNLVVTFSVIDAAGNVADWQGKPYSFSVPTEKNAEKWY
jgi:hypothetical protein